MKVGSRGNIMEWLYDWVETEPNHRHISHLYGLAPSNQITKRGTPQLFERPAGPWHCAATTGPAGRWPGKSTSGHGWRRASGPTT